MTNLGDKVNPHISYDKMKGVTGRKLPMSFIDLSHTIEENMPVFPGTGTPRITDGTSLATDGFLEKKITLFSHTGTHLDAPAHLIAGGKTLDQLPVGHFTGTACILDVRDLTGPDISVEHLEFRLPRNRACDFYLLHTGWSRYWGSPDYFKDFPVLTLPAARLLASLRPKGVGLDAISIDAVQGTDLSVHKIFLGQDTIIVENLKNLDRLPKEPFTFFCFPLKLRDADGSPARAVAEVI